MITRFSFACCVTVLASSLFAEETSLVVAPASDNAMVLLGELNCTACHANDSISSKQPPILSEVGKRITPNYLAKFIASPQSTKPGTPMPDMLHHLSGDEKAKTVEALTHYLASLGGPINTESQGASEFQIAQGEKLYHSVGCVACHQPYADPPERKIDKAAEALRDALREGREDEFERRPIPHGDLSQKTTVEELAKFLANPLHVRPSGRMPSLLLSKGEARMIASYLLRDQMVKEKTGWGAGLDWALYKGGPDKMPAFDSLTPVAEGAAKGFNLKELPKLPGSNFSVRFQGAILIEEAGDYEFFTRSDDGSVLTINGKRVVDNDGIHAPQDATGKVSLSKGRHTIELGFTQGGGGYELAVKWKKPGDKRFTTIPADALLHGAYAMVPKGLTDFQLNNDKVAAGRKSFASLGCANCHDVGKNEQKKLASLTPVAPALAKLDVSAKASCIALEQKAGQAKFALSKHQSKSLGEALKQVQGEPSSTKQLAAIEHTVATMNCYACHQRGDKGGPSDLTEPYFGTTMEVDLGDEGRLPPSLDGVGAKLTAAGFAEQLLKGDTFRPHMATRMPLFGKENVGHLPELLTKADVGKLPKHEPAFSSRLVDDGRRLVGKKALGCINCHAWGSRRLPGADGLDLLRMNERLRPEWFHEFLKDPQVFKPRTRMPTGWPDGKSFFPDVQNGDTDRQIDAVWAYLSVGEKSGAPRGLNPGDEYLLTPDENPIVFRTFLNGVGAHAITVGFRQRTNVAYDALGCRLAKAWAGDFVSAQPAWNGRAGQYATIPGGAIVDFAAPPLLAVLESKSEPWPTFDPKLKATPKGFDFRGYRLDSQRSPTFLTTYGDIRIEETPQTDFRREGAFLRRKIRFTSKAKTPDDLTMRIIAHTKLEPVADSKTKFQVNDEIAISIISANSTPRIREIGDQKELVLPITLEKNGDEFVADVVVETVW